MSKKIGAVITTLNEETTVGKLIRDLRSQGFLVCVIDDNSTDKTRDELHYNGAQIQIFNSVRVGIGPCLMDGWKCLLENNCDYIVQIDAGGSHDPLDAALLLAMLETCEADIVIGSRFTWSSKYIGDRKRQMLSRLAAVACNLVTKTKFHN
jgi:glycosyltransferase involved in cell wall biosynthesis